MIRFLDYYPEWVDFDVKIWRDLDYERKAPTPEKVLDENLVEKLREGEGR